MDGAMVAASCRPPPEFPTLVRIIVRQGGGWQPYRIVFAFRKAGALAVPIGHRECYRADCVKCIVHRPLPHLAVTGLMIAGHRRSHVGTAGRGTCLGRFEGRLTLKDHETSVGLVARHTVGMKSELSTAQTPGQVPNWVAVVVRDR